MFLEIQHRVQEVLFDKETNFLIRSSEIVSNNPGLPDPRLRDEVQSLALTLGLPKPGRKETIALVDFLKQVRDASILNLLGKV